MKSAGLGRAIAGLALAGLSLPTPLFGQGTADLEKAAKKEGRLRIVVFPSLKPPAEAFERKYGIKIEGVYVGEPDILRKVSTESQAGIFEVDLFTTSSGPGGNQLNKWSMPYTPVGAEKVAEVRKALPAEWNQIPLFNHIVGVVYHKELVPPHLVPRSIYDLHRPEFKGKIISRTPWLGSNYLTHMLSYFTWFERDMNRWRDFWTRFKANVGRYEPGFPAIHFAVGLKEFWMAVFSLTYAPSVWGGSYPGLAYSTFKEGAIWWPNMAVIHKNAPRPNAAKLFTNYLISEEAQKIFADEGLIPANKAVPVKPELKRALEGIRFFNDNFQSLLVEEDSKRGDEWRKRIQEIYK
jgi:iron(III) transport system substrate-binding protein